jgi:hypothetical protein
LHAGPWKVSGSYKYALTLRISLQKELRSRNVVLGAAGGAGGGIPARSGSGVGRGRAWGGPQVPWARFRILVGVVVAPVGSHGGGDCGEPLCPLLRRGCGRAKEWGGSGSFSRARGGGGGLGGACGRPKPRARRGCLYWRRRAARDGMIGRPAVGQGEAEGGLSCATRS